MVKRRLATGVHPALPLLPFLLRAEIMISSAVPNMRSKRNTIAIVACAALLSCFCAFGQSDGLRPKNVLLGGMLFERPESWLWVPTEDVKESHKFIITDKNNDELASVLMFFHEPENGTNTHRPNDLFPRWKEQFSPRTLVATNQVRIGGHVLSSLRVEGTQRPSKTRRETRSDYALFGVLLEIPAGTISARVVGPTPVAQNMTFELLRMIEESVKDGAAHDSGSP